MPSRADLPIRAGPGRASASRRGWTSTRDCGGWWRGGDANRADPRFPRRVRGGRGRERGGLRGHSRRARLGRRRPARAAVPGRLSLARRRRRAPHRDPPRSDGVLLGGGAWSRGHRVQPGALPAPRRARSPYPALPVPARGASRKASRRRPPPSRHVLWRERPRGLRARALDGHGRRGRRPRDQRLARESGLGLSVCPAGEPGCGDPVAQAPARLPLCPPASRPPPRGAGRAGAARGGAGARLRPFPRARARHQHRLSHPLLHGHPRRQLAGARATKPRRARRLLRAPLLVGGEPVGASLSRGQRGAGEHAGRGAVSARGITVECVDPTNDPRWLALLHQSSAGLFHSPPWLRALSEAYGFTVRAYCATDAAGEPVGGLAFCEIADALGRRLVSVPFSDVCDPLVSSPEAWNALFARLQAHGAPIHLRCLDQGTAGADERLAVTKRARWHTLSLRGAPEALWDRLVGSTQRAIRRAEREGVVVRPLEGAAGLRE